MEERIQVHHNYISAVSNREHKKDLIDRLKRNDPHNIPAYEAEMAHHMAMHDNVLGRILTILKQDDYYRTLEELPVINSLRAYDDIQLFPELYDTTTIIERVTGEADLIKRQLKQPGMYPSPKTPLPSTSGFVPKPTPTFQPIVPDTSSIHHTNNPQSVETSPGSSIPCGQQTPRESTSTNSEPFQHTPLQSVVPPQPSTLQSPNPSNTPMHAQSNKTPQPSFPTQLKQQSTIRTDVNPSTQPFIPAAETQPVSSSPQQNIPKLANGERVKCSKQQVRQKDECICFCCNLPGHLKRNCPELPYCSKCRTRGHVPVRCPNKPHQDKPTCEMTEESRDQWKRTQDLPQFSNQNNRCLHCAGNHQTQDCMTSQQHHAPTTNNPTGGTGTSTHYHAPNLPSFTSSQSNTGSPTDYQHSQSTIHVQTPTLMVNGPQFQPNLQQPPPAPVVQTNHPTNYHT